MIKANFDIITAKAHQRRMRLQNGETHLREEMKTRRDSSRKI